VAGRALAVGHAIRLLVATTLRALSRTLPEICSNAARENLLCEECAFASLDLPADDCSVDATIPRSDCELAETMTAFTGRTARTLLGAVAVLTIPVIAVPVPVAVSSPVSVPAAWLWTFSH